MVFLPIARSCLSRLISHMVKAQVYNQTGQQISQIELNPKIFGQEQIDPHLVHFVVRAQRNNARQAVAHTKNRGEIQGGGKKPWKQKGTGRARAGSIRSPLWRGGGITFGPRSNRNFSIKLNRKAFRKALFTVLTDKLNDKKLVILDNLDTTGKAKDLASKLSQIAKTSGLGKKHLLVLSKSNKDMERAARNLPDTKVLPADQLNILDLLKFDTLITKDALPVIEQTYLK